MEGSRMFKLPVRTWVRNAAAVFSGQYGFVTGQAQDSQCSRETVYEHARKVEERQAEDLFQILLPPGQAPDHSTIGRWVKTEAKRAAEVLQVLDQKCATKVQTL